MWSRIAKRYSAAVELPTAEVEHLRSQLSSCSIARICYVLRRPSYLESAMLRCLTQAQALPVPTESTQPDFASDSIIVPLRYRLGSEAIWGGAQRAKKSRTRLFSALLGSPSPDTTSVVDQSESILFVPVSFFAGRGPHPIPGEFLLPLDFSAFPLADLWRLLLLRYHRSTLTCLIGPGIRADCTTTPQRLKQALAKELYLQEKRVRGARSQTAEKVEEIILDSEGVQEAMRDFAHQQVSSHSEAQKAARKRFREMAASVRGSVIAFFSWLFRPVVETVFSEIEVGGVEEVQAAVRKSPVVLLPSHRSHFDYILVSYVLYMHKLPLPYVAAGINLNFWPFGPLARSAGGFFIRRSIGGDFLYRAVLDAYLRYLAKRGHMLEFFIEGGRSRSGAMRQPKIGLLKYLLEGWRAGERDDLLLFPVSISYEQLVEEKSLHRERTGSSKAGESIRGVLKLWNIHKKRFGSVVVEFDQPISLNRYFSRPESLEGPASARSWEEQTEDLAYEIARRIEETTALTNTAIAATVVLAADQTEVSVDKGVLIAHALFSCATLTRGASEVDEFDFICWCRDLQITASSGLRRVFESGNFSEAIFSLFSHLVARNLASVRSLGELKSDVSDIEDVSGSYLSAFRLGVEPEHRAKLAYYKNNCMHLFLPAALLGVAGMLPENLRGKALYRLQQMSKAGFLLPLWSAWREELAVYVRRAESLGWIDLAGEFVSEEDGTTTGFSLTPTGVSHLCTASVLLRPYFFALVRTLELLEEGGVQRVPAKELRSLVVASLPDSERQSEHATEPTLEFAFQFAVRTGLLVIDPGESVVVVSATDNRMLLEQERRFFEECVRCGDSIEAI